jgi:radical SAM superfamily enzyme YgiQ (UPF0313 family)
MTVAKNIKSIFITLPQRGQPEYTPPFGAMAVINSLHKAGYKDTTLYNIDVLRPSREDAIDYIVKHNPEILCISAPVSTGYENCKFFSLELKQRLPKLIIVLGGNMAVSAEILLQKTGVDFCVLGEGESVCCQLFDKIEKSRPRKEFYAIKGLAFFDGVRIVNTGYADELSREKIFDIDWDIFDPVLIKCLFPRVKDMKQQRLKTFFNNANGSLGSDLKGNEARVLNKRVASVFCSKGCVTHCSFCHRFNKGIRIIPPGIVISRIKELIERFDVGVVFFSDECFGASYKWLKEFCELIKPLNILWRVGGMRVSQVSPDIIKMMKEAGCRSVIYGMESGSERILQVMEKNVSLQNNYNAFCWTIEAGLYTAPALVIGMPGECSETIKETADFLSYALTLDRSQNPKNISMNFALALPGTPLYEYGRSVGLIGTTIEEEEQYLLSVSDTEAGDGTKTINFTHYPRFVLLSYPRFIRSIVNYRYMKKFGVDHYYKMIFHEYKRPNILHILKNKNISDIFYLYPTLVYKLRHLLWIVKFMEIIKANGLVFTSVLLREYLTFLFNKRRKRFSFEYKSLRKIIDQDIKKAYAGTKEMISLRKGR